MSDAEPGPSDSGADVTPAASATPAPTAGRLIREAREAAGLHIGMLAVALKVPVRKLEALEADQLTSAADAVFTRALASSVCRHLKVDPAPVLALLPGSGKPRLTPAESVVKAPYRESAARPRASAPSQTLSRPTLIAVAALLAGALILMLVPNRQASQSEAPAQSQAAADRVSAAATGSPPTLPLSPAAPELVPAAEGASSAQTSSAPASAAVALPSAAPVAPAVPVAAAVAQAPAASAVGAGTAAERPASPARGGVISFSSSGESWVEVTDATGAVTLRRILSAGDSVSASGVLPLSVVIGRADLTTVTVRGQRFDTSRHARDNVARFEVK